ncbi:mannose-1-phosphate guanylyltransferase/mannose-6-phosphate isomerase [Helicobacter aurati]|uniref:mannose-1-phosphate guanylyltransferase n=1 Tax=Helicobacter aurati TaxID=137778 RepID=A0A3D8J5X3_9HELI|nr:mannose-1-phosphate guanylyltransferase/mannose-6-phosphate isomerase [Helicobacter aurati]RDU72863.1 mannose-1-phosphate guanylyltransferase/mannose-6-phosphate isomerase [Helicobacter aurati]
MTISILCGGSGTRLFPLSRSLMPKQFIKLIGEDSLFKLTLRRNAELLRNEEQDRLEIITNELHYFLALDEAKEEHIAIDSFILESCPRNTAAALTISALITAQTNPHEIILSIPSDHLIDNEEAYKQSIRQAESLAKQGYIVVFGILPLYAHTGYGYIETNKDYNNGHSATHNVIAFHEKPSLDVAQAYLQQGCYYWNSGMFCYEAGIFLEEMQIYQPEMYQICLEIVKSLQRQQTSSHQFLRIDKTLSAKIEDISIDYALIEKTKKLKMVEGNFQWNDVGCFDALQEVWGKLWHKDTANNISKGILESIHSTNNLIMSNKAVATIGLNDYIVIDTFDVLLIAKKGSTQEVKQIVQTLQKTNANLVNNHNEVHRPWGNYKVLLESHHYKLKSILVKPKQRLSLQKHYHRNEHWIVVSGSAIVQIGTQEFFLKPNESTYIPMGETHRLTNPGNIDLVIIEVQVGEYLGEDDIVRMEDDYLR